MDILNLANRSYSCTCTRVCIHTNIFSNVTGYPDTRVELFSLAKFSTTAVRISVYTRPYSDLLNLVCIDLVRPYPWLYSSVYTRVRPVPRCSILNLVTRMVQVSVNPEF